MLKRKKQLILAGPPGAGKTFFAEALASHLCSDVVHSDGERRWRIIQFHPAYSYEDFVSGLRPQGQQGDRPSFAVQPGHLLRMILRAEEAPDDDFCLVIDEFNRANLSTVLGELYTLLGGSRDDAPQVSLRDAAAFGARGQPEWVDSTGQPLPGQPEWVAKPLSLPSNLYLICTMNTADRSIASLDAALQRRFAYVLMAPSLEVDESMKTQLLLPYADANSVLRKRCRLCDPHLKELCEALDAINKKLSNEGFEPGERVGPSYFLGCLTPGDVTRAWKLSVKPYLEDVMQEAARACIKEAEKDFAVLTGSSGASSSGGGSSHNLLVGDTVLVSGLAATQYNGLLGKVRSSLTEGRYHVELKLKDGAPRPPSAWNLFMKDEVARLKAANSEMSDKEAFKEAARNWDTADANPKKRGMVDTMWNVPAPGEGGGAGALMGGGEGGGGALEGDGAEVAGASGAAGASADGTTKDLKLRPANLRLAVDVQREKLSASANAEKSLAGWLTALKESPTRSLLLAGPPGCGKTYTAVKIAEAIAGEGRYEVITFGPGYSYEEFIQGIRPDPANPGAYKLQHGKLLDANAKCNGKLLDANDTCKADPYVLIIDEFNRAKLPAVMGECLRMLEYRDPLKPVELRDGTKVTLSEDLYIIATMNNADRSVEPLDAAMRRRFSTVTFDAREEPFRSIIRSVLQESIPEVAEHVIEFLAYANGDGDEQIGILGVDEQIGISYFCDALRGDGVDLVAAIDELWKGEVRPYVLLHCVEDEEKLERITKEYLEMQSNIARAVRDVEATQGKAGQGGSTSRKRDQPPSPRRSD